MNVTMFEAKTKLSELVRKAQQGEEVIITSGRERKPVVRLQPVEPVISKKPQRLGILYNPHFKLPPTFDDPLPAEELRLWNGEGD